MFKLGGSSIQVAKINALLWDQLIKVERGKTVLYVSVWQQGYSGTSLQICLIVVSPFNHPFRM
jgi:hypothetical protein